MKVEVRYSPKRKKFLVKINNTRFYDLAYRASSFDPNAPRPDFCGVIDVNGKIIINGTVPWFLEAMQDRIDKVTNYDQLRTFRIKNVGASGAHVEATLINELFDLLAN